MKGFDFKVNHVLIIFIGFLHLIAAYTPHFNQSVILKGVNDYCEIVCPNKTQHTLCKADDNIISEQCSANFHEYDLDQDCLKSELMDGHNGLRNRIADKMFVSNMRKLSWDPELSRMASLWIRQCKSQDIKDPCTGNETTTVDGKPAQGGEIVFQIITYKRSKFFPPKYISEILRVWYLEKNLMKPPKITKNRGNFRVNNHFTQLAWAGTFRIGCAIARNWELYILICNYYPYNNPSKLDTAFVYGKPVSFCPNLGPLQDVKFTNLCTGDSQGHRIEATFSAIFFSLLFAVLNKEF